MLANLFVGMYISQIEHLQHINRLRHTGAKPPTQPLRGTLCLYDFEQINLRHRLDQPDRLMKYRGNMTSNAVAQSGMRRNHGKCRIITPERVCIGVQRPLNKCSPRVMKRLHSRASAIAWKVNEKACISRYPN